MSATSDRLAVVTGEASGDLIAADALAALMAMRPAMDVGGIGGQRLADIGMDCWFSSDDLAVRGYVEALSRIVHILAVRYWLMEYLDKWKPGLFLGVDAPDFNLGVEARLRARGLRTVHLISPSIWAWRPERILKIRRAVDHMLCIFPFEPECYKGSGVQATYVGHPIADRIPITADRTAARAALASAGVRLSADGSRPLVAVLPGSRASEIRYNGAAFLGAAALLCQRCDVVVAAASPVIAARLRKHPAFYAAAQAGVQLIDQPASAAPVSHTVMAAADVVLVASGTATLEAALFKRPMVIGYRVPALTYAMMRQRALIRDIGLPNILLGHRAVPELIQGQASAQGLAAAVLHWLDHPAQAAELVEKFHGLHETLRLGAAGRIAQILSDEFDALARRG